MGPVLGKASLFHRIWGPSGARLVVGDASVLSLLVALIVAASLPRTAGGIPSRAQVLVSGKQVLSLDLSRNATQEILGPIGVTHVEVRGGRVRVLSSPCPHQICRHGGWIGEPGTLLVCLPNEVVIRVPGDPTGRPAAITR